MEDPTGLYLLIGLALHFLAGIGRWHQAHKRARMPKSTRSGVGARTEIFGSRWQTYWSISRDTINDSLKSTPSPMR
jgi:hypothetical protein